jgi:7-carboxy-7-deazaguanine synthase
MAGFQVTEIFHSIQGESTWAGLPCVFVRLTGCPLRCRWCDTAYAFQGGSAMTAEEILDRVAGYSCPLVELTGGEPLAQAGSRDLLRRLADAGYTVLLETSGACSTDGVDPRVRIILDLKCPGSGESGRNDWSNLERIKPGDELKFVLASRDDYEWARTVIRERGLDGRCPLLFSPVWGELPPGDLSRWMLGDGLAVRLQIPLHKVIYGPEARGV